MCPPRAVPSCRMDALIAIFVMQVEQHVLWSGEVRTSLWLHVAGGQKHRVGGGLALRDQMYLASEVNGLLATKSSTHV
jgi:hypothetical protein